MPHIRAADGIARRAFLRHAGLLAAAPLVRQAAGGPAPLANVVDTQLHFWARDRERFPFQPRVDDGPEYVTTVEEWLEDKGGTAITHGVLIQPGQYGTDHRYLLHCLEVAQGALWGVGSFPPSSPDCLRQLTEFAQHPHVVGTHTAWAATSPWKPGDPQLEALWEKTGELRLVMGVNMDPVRSWDLEQMVQRYPTVPVVIDHLGRPHLGHAVDYEKTVGLAAYPNVYMKLSGPTVHRGLVYPREHLRPLLQRVMAAFTPARMIWGSDYYRGTMTSADYANSLAIGRELLEFLSPEDQRQVFVETPRRVFHRQ